MDDNGICTIWAGAGFLPSTVWIKELFRSLDTPLTFDGHGARIANIPGDWMAINQTAVDKLSEVSSYWASSILKTKQWFERVLTFPGSLHPPWLWEGMVCNSDIYPAGLWFLSLNFSSSRSRWPWNGATLPKQRYASVGKLRFAASRIIACQDAQLLTRYHVVMWSLDSCAWRDFGSAYCS